MEQAWASADSMKSMFYMTQAAKYTLKARYFEWLSPFSSPDVALGLSLNAQIKITKKKGELLKIKYEEEKSKIKYSTYSAFGVHNTAIQGYRESMNGRIAVQKLMDYVIEQLTTENKIYVHHLYEGIILAIEFDLLRNAAQHLYLLTKSQIRRLLKKGERYKGIEDMLPKYHKKDYRGMLMSLENYRIKRHLKSGKLTLLPGDQKLFYYKQ
jgi:predicted RNA-binding protein Jag